MSICTALQSQNRFNIFSYWESGTIIHVGNFKTIDLLIGRQMRPFLIGTTVGYMAKKVADPRCRVQAFRKHRAILCCFHLLSRHEHESWLCPLKFYV